LEEFEFRSVLSAGAHTAGAPPYDERALWRGGT